LRKKNPFLRMPLFRGEQATMRKKGEKMRKARFFSASPVWYAERAVKDYQY
jgi:hypothetical protein